MNGLLDVQPGSEVPGHSSDMIGQSVPASKKSESVEGEAARESNLRLVLLILLQRRVKGPT